jgi:membrane protein YdbS with pleckstrin-like domain
LTRFSLIVKDNNEVDSRCKTQLLDNSHRNIPVFLIWMAFVVIFTSSSYIASEGDPILDKELVIMALIGFIAPIIFYPLVRWKLNFLNLYLGILFHYGLGIVYYLEIVHTE